MALDDGESAHSHVHKKMKEPLPMAHKLVFEAKVLEDEGDPALLQASGLL